MKKMIVVATISFISIMAGIGCGSNPRKDTNNPAQDSLPVGSSANPNRPDNNVDNPRALTGDSAYAQGAVLVANNDCKTCHAIDKQMLGPSYNMIADKYTNGPGMQDELANKIRHGGSGRWGTKAMPAHPNVTVPEGHEMAKYILSLKSK